MNCRIEEAFGHGFLNRFRPLDDLIYAVVCMHGLRFKDHDISFERGSMVKNILHDASAFGIWPPIGLFATQW